MKVPGGGDPGREIAAPRRSDPTIAADRAAVDNRRGLGTALSLNRQGAKIAKERERVSWRKKQNLVLLLRP